MSALSILATGLAKKDFEVQSDSAQPRAILTGGHLLLPDAMSGKWSLAQVAVAHALAHWRYSVPGKPIRGLKPMGVAIISAIEDARVERLLLQSFPGMRSRFLDFLSPRPAAGDLSFAALVARMDRVLADPLQQDDNHWVNKARRLFDETTGRAGLDDYDAFRAIAAILANDLGQMRVRFDPQHHVVPAIYRDDNSYLWNFSDSEQTPDGEVTVHRAAGHAAKRPLEEGGDSLCADSLESSEMRFQYPEWDYRIERLKPEWCTVIEKAPALQDVSRPPNSGHTPERPLQLTAARRVRRTRRLRRQWEGDDIDLNAAIDIVIDRRLRLQPEPRMFVRRGAVIDESATLVLLDLSESANDRAEGNQLTLLDIEKQAALLMANTASLDGNRIAIHGFSSNTRAEVYYTKLIEFGTMPTPASIAHVAGVKARYSTRIGAAIRHATTQILQERVDIRNILLVTDGTPGDIDVHDSRYLVEDARSAVIEARKVGVQSFCIAVDAGGDAYAQQIFGWRNYCVAINTQTLPTQLQRTCARLASN